MAPEVPATLEAYTREEWEGALSGERLLSPEHVVKRLGITKRQLQELHSRDDCTGLFLPPLRLGKKTVRYRLKDVLRLEWQSMQVTASEFGAADK